MQKLKNRSRHSKPRTAESFGTSTTLSTRSTSMPDRKSSTPSQANKNSFCLLCSATSIHCSAMFVITALWLRSSSREIEHCVNENANQKPGSTTLALNFLVALVNRTNTKAHSCKEMAEFCFENADVKSICYCKQRMKSTLSLSSEFVETKLCKLCSSFTSHPHSWCRIVRY